MQIAVHPLGGPGAALGRQRGQRLERGPQPGGVRPQRGHRLRGRLQALHHARGHQLQLGVAESDRGQRAGERGVHLRGGPPERPRLHGEVLALGQLAQRQLPAVRGTLHEGLEHPEDVRVPGQLRPYPRRRRRYPGAALAGQRERQLQVGVDARDDPAQQLQDEGVAVDDRGVGLLGGHHPRHQTGADLLVGIPLEEEPADAGLGAQRLQEHLGGPGVVQGLVHRASGERALFHMADQRGRQPGRQRLAHTYEELVAVAGHG